MSNYLTTTILFEGQELTLIRSDGEIWLTAEQIGKALGMRHPSRSVRLVYARHIEEFEDGVDVSGINLIPPAGGARQYTLVFSPTGCMLLGMFARTDRAAAFRRWAKHLLARAAAEPRAVAEEALRQRPLWRRILQLRQYRDHRGRPLANTEIARLLGLHPTTLRRHLRRMEALGIIPRPAQLQQRQQAARRLNARREVAA